VEHVLTLLKEFPAELDLRAYCVQNCIVCHDVAEDAYSFHLIEEFIPLFPKIATRAGADRTVVNVDVGGHVLDFHSLHEQKCNVGAAALFHTRHGSTKYDDVLLDSHLRHFIQEFEALPVLET
jgi:hypothetical protein